MVCRGTRRSGGRRRRRRRRLRPRPDATISAMQSTPAMLSGRRVTWFAYAYLCVVGFLLYAIGALTPYLRDALHLSAAEAALHASVLAVGLMVAGSSADAVERRLGRRRAGIAAAALVVAGGVAVMLGGVLPVTLAGAFAIGLGAGVMLAALNIVLGSPGGALAETRFARANTWALLSALIAPLLIAGLASSSLGWQSALLVPLVAAVALEVGRRASRRRPPRVAVRARGRCRARSGSRGCSWWRRCRSSSPTSSGARRWSRPGPACRGRRRRRSRPASSAGCSSGGSPSAPASSAAAGGGTGWTPRSRSRRSAG